MKLKRVDDKPIVLHTKQKATLKIKKKSKLGDKKKFSIRTRKFRYKDVRLEPGSIKMKHHNLKAAMKTGGRAVAKNLDGGEEVADSLHVATTIVSPMMDTARKGTVFARKKKQKKSMTKQRRRRNRMITKEEYVKKNLHVRRSGGKRNSTEKKGKAKVGIAKQRMMGAFFDKLSLESKEGQGNIIDGTKNMVRAAALMVGKAIATTVLPFLLLVFLVVAAVAGIIAAVLGAIYESPFAIFLPTPETRYESPRTVLGGYYRELNEDLQELEDGGATITYQNMEEDVALANFNDTLMVYITLYGSGSAAYVMDETGQENLKTVFDAMNYYDTSSTTKKNIFRIILRRV